MGRHYMTYQDFVKCYPWVDLLLELFKGIMPTTVALFAIFMNNSLSKKRDLMYKKRSLQLDYFIKILNWLHEIKNDVIKVSRYLDNALNVKEPNERVDKYNEFIRTISNMNERIASWKDTYFAVLASYNCDIKLNQFKQELILYSDNLVRIGNKFINQPDTTMVTDEINKTVRKTNKAIDESIKLLLVEINTLY